MFKQKSILTKIYTPLIGSMVAGFLAVGAVSYSNIQESKVDVYKEGKKDLSVYIKKFLSAKKI